MSDPVIIDTKGMKCPLPVLKARKALKSLPPGGVMEVLATDPGAEQDFQHFCKTTGAALEALRREEGGVMVFVLKKPE